MNNVIDYLSIAEKYLKSENMIPSIDHIEVLGVGTVGIVTNYDNIYGIRHTVYPANSILPLKDNR